MQGAGTPLGAEGPQQIAEGRGDRAGLLERKKVNGIPTPILEDIETRRRTARALSQR
jgi:hypothetical protein